MEQVFRFFTSYLTFLGARLLRIPEIVQGRAKKIPPKIKHIIWNKHLLNSPKLFLSPHAPKHNNQPPKKSPLDINPNLIQSLPPPLKIPNIMHQPLNIKLPRPVPPIPFQPFVQYPLPPRFLFSLASYDHQSCSSSATKSLELPMLSLRLFFSRRPLVHSCRGLRVLARRVLDLEYIGFVVRLFLTLYLKD